MLGVHPATGQPNASSKTSEVTFVLVDASSSMSQGTNWLDAEAVLQRELRGLDATQKVSVNYFGGGTCASPLAIQPPTPAENATWTAPRPSGATQLGAALEAAIQAAGVTRSRIVLVTDGSQTCEPELCQVAQANLPQRSHIAVELAFTEDASASTRDKLQCVVNAQTERFEGTGIAGSATAEDRAEFVSETWQGTPIFLVSVILAVLGSLVSLCLHFGHKAQLLEYEVGRLKELTEDEARVLADASSTPKRTRKPEWGKLVSRGSMCSAALALAAIAAIGWLMTAGGENAQTSIWATLNSPFMSYGVPAIALSAVGFTALQVWGYLENGRQYLIKRGDYEIAKEQGRQKQREEDYRNYRRLRDTLRKQELATRWESNRLLRLDADDLRKIEQIKAGVIELALGQPATVDNALSELERIEKYRYKKLWGSWTLNEFAGLVSADRKFPALAEAIDELETHAALRNMTAVQLDLEKLAGLLRQQEPRAMAHPAD